MAGHSASAPTEAVVPSNGYEVLGTAVTAGAFPGFALSAAIAPFIATSSEFNGGSAGEEKASEGDGERKSEGEGSMA